jgi:hypothetical protein
MKQNIKSHAEAERLLPLLRAIGTEMKERGAAIRALEARIADLARNPALHRGEISVLESELSLHRRELRGVEKEMGRLGCTIDEANPNRILVAGASVSLSIEDSCCTQLSDTTA